MEMGKAGWYVVHTYSGYENKVKVNLEKAIENRGLETLIQEVAVPLEEVVERKDDGTEKKVLRKKFPGYVLVKMVMTEETWYVVRNIRGCTGFVGAKSNSPVPLTDEEVRKMGIREVRQKMDIQVGEPVTIVSGPMKNFSGKVTEVHEEKRKIKVEVQMFGRETTVEMDFDQVEKLR